MIRRLDAGMLQGAFIWVAFNGHWYRAVRLTVWLLVFGFEGVDFLIVGIRFIHSCMLIHPAAGSADSGDPEIPYFFLYFRIWLKTKKTVLLKYGSSCSNITYSRCPLAIYKFVTPFCTDEQHPRVASLALRAIHLLLAPTYSVLHDWN